MELDFFEAGNLATIILTFIVGYAIAYIFKSRGCLTGIITYIICLVIIVIIISALLKGYSLFIENITYSLQEYLYYNIFGLIGLILGFIIGSRKAKKS